MRQKTKKPLHRMLLALLVVGVGVTLMAYPFISNYVFEHRKESIIGTYDVQVDSTGEEEIQALLAEAAAYNQSLFTGHVQLHDPFSEEAVGRSEEDYYAMLSVDGSDVMGYVDIPCIDVSLPIYHGTASDTLEKGVGHLEGTSLPVGGENTHTVLTGHTGLNRAKLFTDLTQMEEGDIFILRVLSETLAYRVDQIEVIEPTELDDLAIVEGKDYCTLVTCTPYGVNSHRLLVRGERTEYTPEVQAEAEAPASEKTAGTWMQEYRKSLLLALLIIAVSLSLLFLLRRLPGEKRWALLKKLLGLAIIAGGVVIYIYPDVQEWRVQRRTESIIAEFEEKYGAQESAAESVPETAASRQDGGGQTASGEAAADTGSEIETETVSGAALAELRQEMEAYNASLVENGQSLLDAWSYEQTPVDLAALGEDSGAIGYIEIPDMEVTLPLYLGASTANMALGAAVMSQTSMPIGGADTNSVIVGHRGYAGAPYFQYIENLSEGSMVYITNPWGKLAYRVTGTAIIDPHETEPILIQPGKDMVTLLTCHPYMSNGQYRYVVYCERTAYSGQEAGGSTEAETAFGGNEETKNGMAAVSDGVEGLEEAEDLSVKLIRLEGYIRKAMPVLVLLVAARMLRGSRKSRRKEQAGAQPPDGKDAG